MEVTLIVPRVIQDVVATFDGADGPLNLSRVGEAIGAARQTLVGPSPAENDGAWAEVLAFALVVSHGCPSLWNTYFGPLASGTTQDGKSFVSPDIADTPADVIAHWSHRARSVRHPVLRARYADLSWDMSRAIANARPDSDMARMAIDAYLESADRGLCHDVHDKFEAVIRGLDLAEMIRDNGRIDVARSCLMRIHRQATNGENGLWWKAFDRLLGDKRARLTEADRSQLVADLEALLARFSDANDPKAFNPHGVEGVARRLIAYYRSRNAHEEVIRLNKIIGCSFEHVASLATPALAASYLQTSVTAYRDAGLSDESKRVRLDMESRIVASREQMATYTFETVIQKEDMEEFLKSVVVERVGDTLARIAVGFVGIRKELEAEVQRQATRAPLLAAIPEVIMAEGHVAAVVGSIEDDPHGRLIQHAARMMEFRDIYLVTALGRAVEAHSLTYHHIVGWAAQTGLFQDLELVGQGVAAWFAGDFVKCIHVLVPQIEVALRAIASNLSLPVSKPHPKFQRRGVSVALNLGDILHQEGVASALGADITLHLRALYTDPQGRNLRNDIAHGLLLADQIGEGMATRVVHTLLVLGIWDKLAKLRT